MKFLIKSILIFVLAFSPAVTVFAANPFPAGGGTSVPQGGNNSGPQGGNTVTLKNPLKEDTLAGLFKTVMDAIFVIAIPFFVLAMAVIGLMFVAARGNPEKLSNAKRAFLYGVMGTGIFFGAWVLVNLLASVMRALGVPI